MSALPVAEFDRACLDRWPEIPWLEPIPIVRIHDEGYGCRLCIARNGLKKTDVLFPSLDEAVAHVVATHPWA